MTKRQARRIVYAWVASIAFHDDTINNAADSEADGKLLEEAKEEVARILLAKSGITEYLTDGFDIICAVSEL